MDISHNHSRAMSFFQFIGSPSKENLSDLKGRWILHVYNDKFVHNNVKKIQKHPYTGLPLNNETIVI
jgi:hypothetical protein